MKLRGKAHKFGDNINTDEIIPAKYLNTQDPVLLGKHCMEFADKSFVKNVKKNDIIVAGKNFGCGSSREHAPIAIKGCGVSCVVAETFARIFYRNAINIGLPLIASGEAVEAIKNGNTVEVDTHKGVIRNVARKKTYKTEAYPPFLERIIKKGGLLNSLKR